MTTSQPITIRQSASITAHRIYLHTFQHLSTLSAKLLLWRYGCSVGTNFRASGRIRCVNLGNLFIGGNVRINSGPTANLVGCPQHTNFWVGPEGILTIEDNVGISNTTIMARTEIRIRNNSLVGGGCSIFDNDFHEIDAHDRAVKTGNIAMAPIEIGPHAFIGAHSIILKGVNIGEGAVIGAGSLVTKDIPPFEVWAGRPARFIRQLVCISTMPEGKRDGRISCETA